MEDQHPDPDGTFSFAPRKARLYAGVAPLAVGGTAIVIVALGAPGFWRALALPMLFVVALIVWRAAQIGLELRNEGVLVRNVFRTYEFRWGEIRRFSIGVGYGMKDCVGLTLKDARLAIDIAATSDATSDEILLVQLRRYAESFGIDLAPELRAP